MAGEIGLTLAYPTLLRASELFAAEDGRVHVVNCLRGGGVAFYAGEQPGFRHGGGKIQSI